MDHVCVSGLSAGDVSDSEGRRGAEAGVGVQVVRYRQRRGAEQTGLEAGGRVHVLHGGQELRD